MKIRLASDIHTEFFGEDEIADLHEIALTPLPDDKNTVLVLAGDIGSIKHPIQLLTFLEAVCPRFMSVLYIPGNHEYYGGDLNDTPSAIAAMVKHIPNLSFGVTESYALGGQVFHGTTLWTDFDNENPDTMEEAGLCMNDYRMIRIGNSLNTPYDTLHRHKKMRAWLQELVKRGDIVFTHHMPSELSVPKKFKWERINGAYRSHLDKMIEKLQPKLWFHGHTHDACDYNIGETRVVCNPRGYGKQYRMNGYNPALVIEV